MAVQRAHLQTNAVMKTVPLRITHAARPEQEKQTELPTNSSRNSKVLSNGSPNSSIPLTCQMTKVPVSLKWKVTVMTGVRLLTIYVEKRKK
jgi:hypothetical protein